MLAARRSTSAAAVLSSSETTQLRAPRWCQGSSSVSASKRFEPMPCGTGLVPCRGYPCLHQHFCCGTLPAPNGASARMPCSRVAPSAPVVWPSPVLLVHLEAILFLSLERARVLLVAWRLKQTRIRMAVQAQGPAPCVCACMRACVGVAGSRR